LEIDNMMLHKPRRVAGVALITALLVGAVSVYAEGGLEACLQAHVAYLASDSLEGRLIGTAAIDQAADYIAAEFKSIGLLPAFEGSYFQDFDLTFGYDVTSRPRLIVGNTELTYLKAFSVIPSSGNGEIGGRIVVAAGEAPADQADLDRAVVLWLQDPDIAEDRWRLKGRDGLMGWMVDRAQTAADAGAAGIIFVTGPSDEHDEALHTFPVSREYSPLEIPVLEITSAGFSKALSGWGLPLEKIWEEVAAQVASDGFCLVDDLAGLECQAEVHIAPRTIRVRNVVGIIAGTVRNDRYVVVGGHYDHLGYGDIASSTPWRREVHNGADDNASGVAVVIELARQLSARADIGLSTVFACFTAEELGALGSEYYVENCPYPADSTVAMINFDTVGRLEDESLVIFGARSATEFNAMLNETGKKHSLDIVEKSEIYGFSDQNAFYARGIPSIHVFTGAHDDYHSPDDDWQKLNYEGLTSITLFAADFIREIARMQDLTPVVEAEEKSQATGSRGQGAFLGIVPDFAYKGSGVGIKGTLSRSPAEIAGLKDGDVIVRIDEDTISDLQALMRVLVDKSPGDEITIQVKRGPEAVVVEAKLGVRSPRE
jgi:hypothetical protein